MPREASALATWAADNPRAAWRALDCADARDSLGVFCGMIEIPGAPIGEEPDEAADAKFLPVETPPAAHHKLLIEKLEAVERGEIRRLMVFMPPGSAKALALDTPIPTPTGWTNMGDLRVGDRVFDENGQPCNVTWVSPIWRDRPVYAVKTDCGDEIIADHDHEWRVRLCGKPRRPVLGNGKGRAPLATRDEPSTRFKIKETHELVRRRAKRPMIERARALELPDADLPIDPYLLGVWLGDGSSASMRVTSSIEDQPWLRKELEAAGAETRDTTVPVLFGVIGKRGSFVGQGLIHDPWHKTFGRKHIPAVYFRASRAQRLALLQGLVDTDGTVCRDRGCTTFCNTNLELAEGVRELVRSLGVKAGWTEGRATLNGVDCGPVYRVGFYLDRSARLPRKAVLTRNQRRTPNTYIDVTPAGRADTVCIEVDSPSHLFLCGRSMTPTHNSTYASVVFPAWFMGLKPRRNVIVATYASDLARKIGRRMRSVVRQPVYSEIFKTQLSAESSAADEWALDNGNEFMAGGILSGITGNRADGFIVDDPVKGMQDATSPVIQKRTKDEYDATIVSRLKPGGWVVLIQTRWDEDDLAGQILPEGWDGESGTIRCRDGLDWDVICIPAEAEQNDPLGRAPGEMLWSEWFGRDPIFWTAQRQNPRVWSALYQQRPKTGDGTFFMRAWFDGGVVETKFGRRVYERKRYRRGTEPKELMVYLSSDHAPTDGPKATAMASGPGASTRWERCGCSAAPRAA